MNLHRLAAALTGACALFFTSHAGATSLIKLSLPEMVDQSKAVVIGKPVRQETAETSAGLYTITTFAVTDSIIGGDTATVSVAVPGGVREINGRRFAETWPGAPRFMSGQLNILFLTDGVANASAVVGYSQGVVNVVSVDGVDQVRLPDSNELITLDDAKTKIRAVKARGKGPQKLGE